MIHPRSPPRIHHCSQIPFDYALLVVNSAAPMLHIIMIQFFQANLEICIFCKVSGPGCCSAIELDWRGAARRGVVHRPACLSQTQATPNYLPWKQLNIHKVSGVPKYNNSIWHLQRFIKISITLKIAPTTHNWNNKKKCTWIPSLKTSWGVGMNLEWRWITPTLPCYHKISVRCTTCIGYSCRW